ncbi:MAG: hypothetical protein DMF53_04280 [Acidobacteria bacterium]|nr:MAG: hypothetical protein DMF53_04280 [Acidobacteriota bacterium]
MPHSLLFARLEVGCAWREEVFAPHSPDVERREGQGMPFEEVFKRREGEGMRLEEDLAAHEVEGM